MACLPIIVLLLLLIKFQWGATEAAPIGLLITIITAVAFYKADFTLLGVRDGQGDLERASDPFDRLDGHPFVPGGG